MPVARRARARAIIRCTGGVRDELDAVTRTALLDAVFAALSANASFPFSLAREDVGVVEGPQEAFYAFVSANFLEGRVDHLLRPRGESAQLLGALDLGGSSTQITYAMSGAESCAAAEDCANESVEPAMLYARSYASFGAQAVRKKMLERLRAAGAGEDPCSHVGYEVGEGLTGGGALEACAVEVRGALLGDARAQTCADADSPQTRRAKCARTPGALFTSSSSKVSMESKCGVSKSQLTSERETETTGGDLFCARVRRSTAGTRPRRRPRRPRPPSSWPCATTFTRPTLFACSPPRRRPRS